MELKTKVVKIPENLAVLSVAEPNSGWKPMNFAFKVPEQNVIFQSFAPFTAHNGDDLRQILIEEVHEKPDSYLPFAQDMWEKKGMVLHEWCDFMCNESHFPDEVILYFLSVFCHTPAAVILRDGAVWTTGNSDSLTEYKVHFIYKGHGKFMPVAPVEQDNSTLKIMVPAIEGQDKSPQHQLCVRECKHRHSTRHSGNVSYCQFFKKDFPDTTAKHVKSLPAALKALPQQLLPGFKKTLYHSGDLVSAESHTEEGHDTVAKSRPHTDAMAIIDCKCQATKKKHKAQPNQQLPLVYLLVPQQILANKANQVLLARVCSHSRLMH